MAILKAPMPHQRGFSLVELMVAVTIGLVILAAVSGIFVTSKTTYNTQDNLARLQENARFAVYYLSDDIRRAGYAGCLESITTVKNHLVNELAFNFNAKVPIEGMDNNAAGNWYPSNTVLTPANLRAGTDAITMRAALPSTLSITQYMPPTSAELNVTAMGNLAIGDIIMVSNCTSADIIQITQTQVASLKIQHAPGGSGASGGNKTPHELLVGYGPGPPPAQLMVFTSRTYYVQNRANTDGTTTPVLVRQDNGGAVQEMIEGVENMQILYGIDTEAAPDGTPNVYLRAHEVSPLVINDVNGVPVNPWTRVRAIRIGLIVRTLGNNEQDIDNSALTLLGENNGIPGDRNQRRIFTFSVNARNL